MIELITIYSSNIPVDCYILKGRLEAEGINCFIYDANIVYVHPFKAVAIGGVKLKVPNDSVEYANSILNSIEKGKLLDNEGEYEISTVYKNEIKRQNKILEIKSIIRKGQAPLENYESSWISQEEKTQIIESEKEFNKLLETKFIFSWKQFLYEFFDFDRSIFTYFRIRPVEYYLDKEMVDNYCQAVDSTSDKICVNCSSRNINYSYAIDYKWDILYLILSFLFIIPFPPIRKKHHCFDCGCNF